MMDVGCSQIGKWVVITITHVVEITSVMSFEVACYVTYTEILDVCGYEMLCSFLQLCWLKCHFSTPHTQDKKLTDSPDMCLEPKLKLFQK